MKLQTSSEIRDIPVRVIWNASNDVYLIDIQRHLPITFRLSYVLCDYLVKEYKYDDVQLSTMSESMSYKNKE